MLRWIALTLLILICRATAVGAQQPVPFPGEPPYTLPKRIALVIGVENYSGGGAVQLPNLPGVGNDARNMAKVLTDAGFDVTLLLAKPPSTWVTQDQINDAITDLIVAAQTARTQTGRGAIVAFYFAGHGLRTADRNYLLPSRFSATFVENIPNRAIELESQVINAFSAADISPELKIIIIDACRTSAPASLPSSQGTDAIELRRGTVTPYLDGIGFGPGRNHTLVLYAALPGKAAFGGDIGGQFTTKFVDALQAQLMLGPQTAGIRRKSLQEIYQQVWTFMMTLSVKKQLPNMDQSLASTFYPLPTDFDFAMEKASFIGVKDVPTNQFQNSDAVDRYQNCEFTGMLDTFSQYSYFSAEIIKRIKVNSGTDPNCLVADPRIKRGPDDRWGQAKTADPSVPPAAPSVVPPTPQSGPVNKRELSNGRPSYALTASTDLSAARNLLHPSLPAQTAGTVKLAQSEGTKERAKDSDAPPTLAPITFADLRNLLSTLPPDAMPSRLPDDAVPLNRTVVTKGKSNLRKAPGLSQDLVSTVAAGEFLEVTRASKGRTWLEVRHPTAGQGYISGDLVEPALVNISKTVSFAADGFEPTKEVLVDLTTALGSLGGVAIVDGLVSYPPGDSRIGFARAAAVRSFVQSLLAPPQSGQSRVYVKLTSGTKDIPPGKVLVTLLGLPLNQTVRAAIARTMDNNSGILLDLDPSRVLPDSELAADGPSAPVSATNICTQGSQCTSVPNVVRPAELNEGLGQITNVQPPIRQSPAGVDGIRNTLKLLRF